MIIYALVNQFEYIYIYNIIYIYIYIYAIIDLRVKITDKDWRGSEFDVEWNILFNFIHVLKASVNERSNFES